MFKYERNMYRSAALYMAIAASSANADVWTNSYTNTYTNTQTCTVNGVRVDCTTGAPLPQTGGTQSELCPSLRYDYQYGRDCTYKVTNIKYKAVKLTHTYSDSHFSAGAKPIFIGHLNDAYKLAGQSIGLDGKRYGFEVQLSDNASNFYYTLLGSYGLESIGGGVDNYGNVVGGSRFANPGLVKSASFSGSGSAYFATDATLFGSSGYFSDVKSAAYPYPIQHRSGRETMADGLLRGVFWTDEGYPYSSSFHKKAVLGGTGDASAALAVSADGIVAGALRKSGAVRLDAVQWSPRYASGYSVLAGLGGDSAALDINNNASSFLVGYTTRTDGYRFASKWVSGSLTQLPNLTGTGNPKSAAYAVTDAKDIVGTSFGRAVIWRDGKVYDLNSALTTGIGTVLTVAGQINRQGLVVAYGADSNYYVLQPTDNIK